MGEHLDQIPERLRSHIQEITRTSGLPEGEESVELIAQAWLEKKKTFEEKIGVLKMEEIETLSRDDTRGAVVMTYSGSLLLIGPLADGGRKAQYISIGLRMDVPDSVEKPAAVLAKNVAADETVEFEEGPVKSTSQVFKIAVLSEKLPLLEEEQKISEATQVIAEEFIEVNRTIISE